MNDKELLELAAKAVGIKKDDSTTNGGGRNNDGFDMLGNMVRDWHNNIVWNPITNDGDALRLAVKLNMQVDIDGDENETWIFGMAIESEKHGSDKYAATRRAIVRAAAEIGKNA